MTHHSVCVPSSLEHAFLPPQGPHHTEQVESEVGGDGNEGVPVDIASKGWIPWKLPQTKLLEQTQNLSKTQICVLGSGHSLYIDPIAGPMKARLVDSE